MHFSSMQNVTLSSLRRLQQGNANSMLLADDMQHHAWLSGIRGLSRLFYISMSQKFACRFLFFAYTKLSLRHFFRFSPKRKCDS